MFPFPAVVPMDVAQQAYVQVRAEERVRSGSDIKAAETEANPLLRYDVIWRGGNDHFVALYQPRFILTHSWDRRTPDPNEVNPATINIRDPNDTPFSTLHNGGFGLEMLRRRWRLSLYQFGAYGPITTTALLVQAPWGGEGVPPDPNPIIPATIGARFTLLFVQTQLFVPIRLSRRLALTPGANYNAFGGADALSRGVLPLTAGPAASLSLDWAASRNDRFVTTVGGGYIETTFQDNREGQTIYRADGNQSWRHFWSNNLSTEVGGGGAVGGDAINGFTFFGIGQGAILYDSWPLPRIEPGGPPFGAFGGRGVRLQMGLIAKVQPWLDFFSGELEQRGSGTFATNVTVGQTTFRASISTARVLATPRSVAKYEIFLAESSIRYRISPTFWTDFGLRYGYQEFTNAIRASEISQINGFANVTWAPLPAKF